MPHPPSPAPPDVILLHGINNTPTSWDPVRATLAGAAVTIAPTLPPLERIGDIADELLSTLTDRLVLVGHSFGGYVALEMLRRAPTQVAAVALVNSHDGTDTEEIRTRREQSITRASAGDYELLAEAATAASYHPDNLSDERLLADRRATVAAYGATSFVAHQVAAMHRADQRACFTNARQPKLVVAGAADKVIPTAAQRAMAAATGAAFVIIERAGHMLPAEQPAALADTLGSWLCEPRTMSALAHVD